VTFDSADVGETIAGTLTGTSAFYILTFNGSGGWTVNNNLEVTNNFNLTNGFLTQGANINFLLTGDNITFSTGTTFTKASGTGIFTMDGLSGNQLFRDLTAGLQDLGAVNIGQSPGTTNLGTDMEATSLTVNNGDILNTKGYDVDISTFVTDNGTFDATDTGGAGYEGDGTVITVGSNWTVDGAATFTADEGTHFTKVVFDETTAGIVNTGGTDENHDFYQLEVQKTGAATVTMTGNHIHIEDNFTLGTANSGFDVSASNCSASSCNMTVGGSWANSGTFTSRTGTVTFDSSNTGETINAGSSNFANVVFNNAAGGWTVQTNNLTATANVTLTTLNDFTLQTGRTMEVRGAYSVCDSCTTGTTWTGSILYLNSASAYTVGTKTQSAEIYGTLQIGANTDIRTWNSSQSTTTCDASGSLYSQDYGNTDGQLYIYGDYHVTGTDYWKYDTDFDGTALGVSSRQPIIRIETGVGRGVTVDNTKILNVQGGGTGSNQYPDINRIGESGTYQLVNNSGSTINVLESKIAYANFNGGNWTTINTQITSPTVSTGNLYVDWYLSIHVVDKDYTSTNIDTTSDDVTISEVSSNATIYKYSGGWGSAASSQTANSDTTGHIPQPNSTGSIRLREYLKTSAATTFYKYNLAILKEGIFVNYDYYRDYGSNYITSVDSAEVSGVDKVIGSNWYRDVIATENSHPVSVNEPPDSGSWWVGMAKAIILFWDGASIPDGWECVSCNVGDAFYQKFVRAAATYGGTGGDAEATTHTHAVTTSSQSLAGTTTALLLATCTSTTHTHTWTSANTNTATITPLYKQLKLIRGPATLPWPAGVIAPFNTATVPTNWSSYSSMNGNYARGGGSVTTGGAASHGQTAPALTSSQTSETASCGALLGGTAQPAAAHTHTLSSFALNSENNEPLYVNLVFNKLDTTSLAPSTALGIFDYAYTSLPNYWSRVSDAAPYTNNLLRGNATPGGTGGKSTHNHNGTISRTSSTYSGSTVNNSAGISSIASTAHTHTVGHNIGSSNSLPEYREAVIGQYTAPTPKNVSGNVYENETATALTICDGSTPMIKMRVGGTTHGPVSCNDATGAFTFTGVTQPAAGTPMIFWIDEQASDKASTISEYSGSGDVTGIELRKDRLMVMSDFDSVSNENLNTYDSGNDSDIVYLVNNSTYALTLAHGYKLIVNSGDTYEPAASVTTDPSSDSSTTDGDIFIESGATMTVGTNALSVGGDWTNSGTFTKSATQTTTFTATTAGHTIAAGSSHFENITFNGVGGAWSAYTDKLYGDGDLTMTAGTLNTATGTADIEVAGTIQGTAGIISTTANNHNFIQRVTAAESFGLTSGSNDWTFYNLKFEDSSAGSAYTITTNTGGTGQIIVNGTLSIGNSGDSYSTTLDNNTNDRILDINGSVNITSKGVLQASSSASFTIADDWTKTGTFTANTGTVTFDDNTKTTTFTGSSDFYNLTSTIASKAFVFANGTTQGVGGALTLNGQDCDTLITLRSDSTPARWNINVSGTSDVDYIDVEDSDASGNAIIAATSKDSGNNDNWTITYGSCGITQRAYIFENDDGADVNSNSDIASANTPLTDVARGERFIARLQLDSGLETGSDSYKLQYDKDGDEQWTDVRQGGGASSNSGGNFGDWEINTASGASEPASVGHWTSSAVPADGKPVISFYNATDGDLAVCKCNDSSCISTPTCNYHVDSTNDVGLWSSLAIGDDGFPIIAHMDDTNNRLRVCDCADASCSVATCNQVNAVAVQGDVVNDYGGLSLAIGTDGYPVISFGVASADTDLGVCKCNDAGCSGANETCSTNVYLNYDAGRYSSIAIGTDGYPIISFFNYTGGEDLAVCKCNDAACTGANETCTASLDTAGGLGTSIAIGTDGLPIIAHHSHYNNWGDSLRSCKCSNTSCTAATCSQVSDFGYHGKWPSLNIGKDGLPVIAEHNYTNGDLYFYKCNDTACAGGNEFYEILDTTGLIGRTPSMAITPDGWPVISYWDETNTNLKVAKMLPNAEVKGNLGISGATADNLTAQQAGVCYAGTSWQDGEWHEATGNSQSINILEDKCTELAFSVDTSKATTGSQYRLRLVDSSDNSLDTYSQYPTFTVVSEVNNIKRYSKESISMSGSSCAGGSSNYVCDTKVDNGADNYNYGTSTAIGLDGNPVVSMYNSTDQDLEVAKCKDPECSQTPTYTKVDTTGNVGKYSKIVIGTDGNPVVASFLDGGAGGTGKVRVCKCTNGDCSSSTCNDVNSWTIGGAGEMDISFAIGADGNPIVSHYGPSPGILDVCHCGNSTCSSGNVCTQAGASQEGMYNSLAIGADGLPVVASYNFSLTPHLVLCHCNNASCTTSACSTIDSSANVGRNNSIAIGTDGYPIITHYDINNYKLRICDCGNTTCSSVSCGEVATVADAGTYNQDIPSSVAIGTDGYPIVSYYDAINGNLKIVDCDDNLCAGETPVTIEATNDVGKWSSLAIGTDGYPVTSYRDITNTNIKVAKGVGLPTTAAGYFSSLVSDRQVNFKNTNTNSQFLESLASIKDGLGYWFDDNGYDDASTDDANLDELTSSASQAPLYTFIDKHSSNTNTLYGKWIGQSTVAASTRSIYLQIYNWNTNTWDTVTTNSSCAADTDCTVKGNKTTNLSYYYFDRHNFDSLKQENDTTPEYFTYWRVYQATGVQNLKTDLWDLEYTDPDAITVSGNAYENETATALDACDGSTAMIKLYYGGTVYDAVSCDNTTGAFTFTNVTRGSTGDPIILWIDGQTAKASTVSRYLSPDNVTGLELRKDRLMIMSDSGNVTNANAGLQDDDNDTDIIYTSNSNNLTLEDGFKLIVNGGDTYEPGGTITTSASADSATTDGDILTEAGATLNVGTSTVSCGGDWTNDGAFTKSATQTTEFTATTSGHTIASGSSNFENVTFSGAGGWTLSGTTNVDGDLAANAGTVSGSDNVTISGGAASGSGTINLSGGTFLLDGTGSFGGSAAWTFNNLTFGNGIDSTATTANDGGAINVSGALTIAANQTLNAGSKTWTLSGAGTVFTKTGTFTADTSTFNYTGNGATDVTSATYYNLGIGTTNSANISYTAQGSIVINRNLVLGSAAATYANTFSVGGHNLTVGSNSISGSGNITVPVRTILSQTSSGTTTIKSSAAGTAVIGGAGSTTFGGLNIGEASDNTTYTLNLGGAITSLGDIVITDAVTGSHTLDVTVGNYAISAGGNWDNNDTFTCQQGTVTFNATSAGKTISDGGSPFYNIIFNGGGGEWLYQDGSSTAPNQTTVQAGTPTFLNAKTGTVSVTSGTLNVDWYVGAHLVDATNTDTNIDTANSDITLSEHNSTPQSSIWRYSGAWGSPASSQTTGTDATGVNPQSNTEGALRIREYSMTNSATCPGAGCTLYKYNMEVNWQANYGYYDYYDGYGENYLTSCWAGASNACENAATDDDVIGQDWYRSTPGTVNGAKPYDGLNEPPDHGTWYGGMIVSLDFSIDSSSVDFGTLNSSNNFTSNRTNTLTTKTGASNGYSVYAYKTDNLRNTDFVLKYIDDWVGTYGVPTAWSGNCPENTECGFGYNTNDSDVSQFNPGEYAGFADSVAENNIVAREDVPTTQENVTMSYKVSSETSQVPGQYQTTIIYVCVPQY
jgi:hypothetical protein